MKREKKFKLPGIRFLAKLPERERENKINEILEESKKRGTIDSPYILNMKKTFINDGYKGFFLTREEIAKELKKISAKQDQFKIEGSKIISAPKSYKFRR